ncbi:CDC27 family protein [Campylobacter fetus]|uniref:CDC27 family protein n=2 Tax=Campylobacter TaxID=194 RepID=UPI00138DFA48|nr:CDC27 family protein [Campylobacter fetus]MDV2489421.1 CDC27 family protein [Campylobacter sp. TJR-1]
MLDSYEIQEMENKWKKYNRNRNKKLYMLSATILICLSISISAGYFIDLYMKKQSDMLQNEIANINLKKHVNELKEKAKIAKQKLEQQRAQDEKELLEQAKKDDVGFNLDIEKQTTLDESLPNQQTKQKIKDIKTADNNNVLIPKIISQNALPNLNDSEITNQRIISDLPLPQDTKILEFSETNQSESNQYQNQAQNKNQAQNSIKIESQTINMSVESLKSKFDSTNDIKYAILLAEEFYKQNDYENAIKWAFTINSIDENEVKGWVIFAKAKYKIGKKEDALTVLNALQEKNRSASIEELIEQIKKETL